MKTPSDTDSDTSIPMTRTRRRARPSDVDLAVLGLRSRHRRQNTPPQRFNKLLAAMSLQPTGGSTDPWCSAPRNPPAPAARHDVGYHVTLEQPKPRSVAVNVTFDLLTFQRLVETGPDTTLTYVVRVTNKNTGELHTERHALTLSPQALLPLAHNFTLGQHFTITVVVKRPVDASGNLAVLLQRAVEHKEVRLKSELRLLMRKAAELAHAHKLLPVHFAFRNKTRQYFRYILVEEDQIMRTYIKDNNGDPGCPINGKLDGLFFNVRPDPKTKQVPTVSFYGDILITIPIDKLIEPDVNVYFADIYCHHQTHHLALVATKPGSEADKFCSKALPRLSIEDNPFLFRVGTLWFSSVEPLVEVMYTEDVRLSEPHVTWSVVRTTGRGSSTPHGHPKRTDCSVCNL